MSNTVLVSIVTPSYNQAKFLAENLNSVSVQRAPGIDIEHLVFDGGSTDGTLELLQACSGVTWVSAKDGGQSDAINKGFHAARGSIVGWINSDDYYLPGAVATAVAFFQNNPDAMWLYGRCHMVDEHGVINDEYDVAEFNFEGLLNRKNFVPQQAVFFRRELLAQVGYLDEDLHLSMDYDLWLRFGKLYPGHFIPTFFACFRRHGDAKTSLLAPRHWAEALQVSRKYGGRRFSVLYFRTLIHAAFRALPAPIKRLAASPRLKNLVRLVR